MSTPAKAALEEARSRHLAGELDLAEQGYRAILADEPEHGEALHLLGLVRQQLGDHDGAVELLTRAVAARPAVSIYRCNLAVALRSRGEMGRSEACLRQAIELDPELAQAHYHLGGSRLVGGDLAAAEQAFRQAVALSPELKEAHYNLGISLQRQGRAEEALAAYRDALAIDPRYAKALLNLANQLHRLERWDEALAAYQRLADVKPDSAEAAHMTAALSGVTTSGCPAAYVRALFDDCAAGYDARLVGELGYEAPQRLRELICSAAADTPSFARAVDLGCGTGLMGKQLRPICDQLIGVDLSPAMIEQARKTGRYDTLEVADLVSHLVAATEPYDLIVAADVLSYWGDLTDCFEAVARCCAPGSWFAFTIEASADDDVVLTRSGRYRHHRRAIDKLAARTGFTLVAERTGSFRREGEEAVAGQLFLHEWGR